METERGHCAFEWTIARSRLSFEKFYLCEWDTYGGLREKINTRSNQVAKKKGKNVYSNLCRLKTIKRLKQKTNEKQIEGKDFSIFLLLHHSLSFYAISPFLPLLCQWVKNFISLLLYTRNDDKDILDPWYTNKKFFLLNFKRIWLLHQNQFLTHAISHLIRPYTALSFPTTSDQRFFQNSHFLSKFLVVKAFQPTKHFCLLQNLTSKHY